MNHATITAALLLAFSAAPSSAQTTEVGCLLTSSIVAPKVTDPKQREIVEAVTYFYLGQLGTSLSPEQLKEAFAKQRQALRGKNAGVLMDACLRPVQERARMVKSVAQQLGSSK